MEPGLKREAAEAEEAAGGADAGHRVLVFAQLKGLLDLVESEVGGWARDRVKPNSDGQSWRAGRLPASTLGRQQGMARRAIPPCPPPNLRRCWPRCACPPCASTARWTRRSASAGGGGCVGEMLLPESHVSA